jgi:hypothetical protein
VQDFSNTSGRVLLQRWNPTTLKRRFDVDIALGSGSATFSNDSSLIAFVSDLKFVEGVYRSEVTMYRTTDGVRVARSTLQENAPSEIPSVSSSFLSDDGSKLILLRGILDNRTQAFTVDVKIWRTADGTLEREISYPWTNPSLGGYEPRSSLISPDGNEAIVFGIDRTVRLNLETAAVVVAPKLEGFEPSLSDALAVSPDGTRLAGINNNVLSVYERSTLKRAAIYPLPDGSLSQPHWNADGSAVYAIWTEDILQKPGNYRSGLFSKCGVVSVLTSDSSRLFYEEAAPERFQAPFEFVATYDTEYQYKISGTANLKGSSYAVSGIVPAGYNDRLTTQISNSQPYPYTPMSLILKDASGGVAWDIPSSNNYSYAWQQPIRNMETPLASGTLRRIQDGREYYVVISRGAQPKAR